MKMKHLRLYSSREDEYFQKAIFKLVSAPGTSTASLQNRAWSIPIVPGEIGRQAYNSIIKTLLDHEANKP